MYEYHEKTGWADGGCIIYKQNMNKEIVGSYDYECVEDGVDPICCGEITGYVRATRNLGEFDITFQIYDEDDAYFTGFFDCKDDEQLCRMFRAIVNIFKDYREHLIWNMRDTYRTIKKEIELILEDDCGELHSEIY